METEKKSAAVGYLCQVIAMTLYALLVFYWKAIKGVPEFETLAFRVVMCAVSAGILLVCTRKFYKVIAIFKNKKMVGTLFLAGLMQLLNWGSYIWGVSNGYVVECSLGYFINPLLTALFGILFCGEKVDKYIVTAAILALSGVLILTFNYGRFPVIAILLALTYSTYLLLKKKAQTEPIPGIFIESAVMAPLALPFLIYLFASSKAGFVSVSFPTQLLVLLVGLVTLVPIFFVMQAQFRISMISIGLLSYISPICTMLIGVLVYKEDFTIYHAITVALILIAGLIFTYGQVKKSKAASATLKENQAVRQG